MKLSYHQVELLHHYARVTRGKLTTPQRFKPTLERRTCAALKIRSLVRYNHVVGHYQPTTLGYQTLAALGYPHE